MIEIKATVAEVSYRSLAFPGGCQMRLTMRTDLAIRTLMYCAVNEDRPVRKSDIAASCNASANHLGLVIQILGQEGFVTTLRGRRGGIRLARPPEAIFLGDVCRRVEADMPLTECFDAAANTCPLAAACRLRGALRGALGAFYDALNGVSLADLVAGNHRLERLFAPQTA